MSRRQSTRSRKATNYDIKDAFKDLSDDPDSPAVLDQEDEASDEDFGIPDQNDGEAHEDSGDDGNISEVASSSSEESEHYSDASDSSKCVLLFKGGDPAAGSPTATLLRLHPSR